MNDNLQTWHFGMDNDRLVDLVLAGQKIATTSYLDEPSPIGEESILVYDNEKTACVTKTIKVMELKFKDVDWELAKLEGENETLEEWREIHRNFFKSIDKNFNDESLIIFEIFEVTRNLKKERLELAKTVVNNNLDIFKSLESIQEINAGFNNSLFDINSKFIIKICGDSQKENLFDVEYNFYESNKENKNIPKLYKYDKSKKIINYVYEIIEKINGKSIYYHWYKWNELERESFINKLVNILKQFHKNEYNSYDWCHKIREEIEEKYLICKDMFNEKERNIIEKTFTKYEEILCNNKFVLIHNDLHFDNILLDENNDIKIIDFNDAMVAPFDFDLRLLFMCKEQPWKWANIEMDPFQKPEDYQYIIEYLKKYYVELNNIKYLDKRMSIYKVLNDIRHLPKYRHQELIDRIVKNSNDIIN